MTTPEQETADPGQPADDDTDTRSPGSDAADTTEAGTADSAGGQEVDADGAAEQAPDSTIAEGLSVEMTGAEGRGSEVVDAEGSGSQATGTEGEGTLAEADSATDADATDAMDAVAAGADPSSHAAAQSADDATEPVSPGYPDDATELPLDLPTSPPADVDAEDDDDDSGGAASSRVPDLTDDEVLHSALEALLLVVDSPAEVEDLADALSQPVKRVRAALKTMSAQYHEQNRGIDLRDVGGGWRFYTRDKYAPFVEKLLHDGQRAKLTRAALESLAVIAYRQPVTRARVAAVRGVNVDGVIRTLVVRGLIEETGADKETGGILYRTTELFLERLGLSSLEDLPPIAPLLPEVDAIDDV